MHLRHQAITLINVYYHFSLELKWQAPACPPASNFVHTKCILSYLAKLVFQKCKYVHVALLHKIHCPSLSFRIKLNILCVAPKPPTLRLLPLSPSLSLPLTFLLHVKISLDFSWSVAFTEYRPLHISLHPRGAIVLFPFLHNLANSWYIPWEVSLISNLLVFPAVPSPPSRVLCVMCSNILQLSIYLLLYVSMSWLLLSWQGLTLQ